MSGIFNGGDKISFSLYNFNFSFYENIKLNNIPIGLTDYESDLFSNINFDGFIGLGGFYGNETIVNNITNNIITYFMFEQKIIKNNMFSLYINVTNAKSNTLNMYGGEITFGKFDKRYVRKIKWYDIYKKTKYIIFGILI